MRFQVVKAYRLLRQNRARIHWEHYHHLVELLLLGIEFALQREVPIQRLIRLEVSLQARRVDAEICGQLHRIRRQRITQTRNRIIAPVLLGARDHDAGLAPQSREVLLPAAVPAIDEEPEREDCNQHGSDRGQPPARRLLGLSSGLPKQAILQMWARAIEYAGVSTERAQGSGEFLVNPFILPGEDIFQLRRRRAKNRAR